MKVNFLARYSEVSRLLREPPARGPSADAFEATLHSLAPKAEKKEEFQVVKPRIPDSLTPTKHREPELMARYSFQGPALERPEFAPAVPDEEPVNEAAQSVKSPTIIRARRIHSPESLSALPLPEKISAIRGLVESAGEKHGIDPALGLAIVANESSFDPFAVSRDGFHSKGLFQLLDSTGKERLKSATDNGEDYDPFNPQMNVELGVGYLKHLHEIFRSETELSSRLKTVPAANSQSLEKLAIASFNAGEGRVASAQKRAKLDGFDPGSYDAVKAYLPEITQRYVEKVVAAKSSFGARPIG